MHTDTITHYVRINLTPNGRRTRTVGIMSITVDIYDTHNHTITTVQQWDTNYDTNRSLHRAKSAAETEYEAAYAEADNLVGKLTNNGRAEWFTFNNTMAYGTPISND